MRSHITNLIIGAMLTVVSAGTASAALVRLNEFLPNPAGSDNSVEMEWIELTSTGLGQTDLNGWKVERATTLGGWSDAFTFSGSTLISPGQFFVIGESNVAGADINLGPASLLGLGNASSTGDVLRLVDNSGGVMDTVVYGPNNNDGFLDDTGAPAAPAPQPLSAQSVARIFDGVDTDNSAFDFMVTSTPTMGVANAAVPIPATVWLLGSALGGMAGLRRRAQVK